MRVLICPDKFKFTYSAMEIGMLIKRVFERLGHRTELVPMSDGGEGFLDVLSRYVEAERVETRVYDSVLRPLDTYFLYDKTQRRVYIELALTGSLQFLSEGLRNPLNTTTYGLGLQLKKAMDMGAEKIFVGLGGSSTTDCGMVAVSLGINFIIIG